MKRFSMDFLVLCCLLSVCGTPVFAQTLLAPAATGDNTNKMMPIIIGLLVVSVLVVISYVVFTMMKKKKK